MNEEIKRHVEKLLRKGGQKGENAKKYVEVDQQLSVNPNDPHALEYKLRYLAELFETASSAVWDGLSHVSFWGISAYWAHVSRPEQLPHPDVAVGRMLRDAILEEARPAFETLSLCLPPTPANASAFLDLLEVGCLPLGISSNNEVPIIQREPWERGPGYRYNLPGSINEIDRLRWCANVVDRMMTDYRVESLLCRASLLRDLCGQCPTSSTVLGCPAVDDAMHLTSFDLLWDELDNCSLPELPDRTARLLRRWVLGDCLDVLSAAHISVDVTFNAISLLSFVNPELGPFAEGMVAAKKLKEADVAKWHLAMMAFHLEAPERAVEHATAALDMAKHDMTKRMAALRLRDIASKLEDKAVAWKLDLKALSIIDPDGLRLKEAAAAMLPLLRRWFKWDEYVDEQRVFDSVALDIKENADLLPVANACVGHVGALFASVNSLTGHMEYKYDHDYRVDFVNAVASLYLRQSRDEATRPLAETIIAYCRRSGDWGGPALDAALKLGDLDAFGKVFEFYRKCRESDLVSVIRKLPPDLALRAAAVLAERQMSSEPVEALVRAVDSMLAGAPLPEEDLAVAVRGRLIEQAFTGKGIEAAIITRPKLPSDTQDELISSSQGMAEKVLEDASALPYISAMKAAFKEDFPDWLKLFGMQLMLDRNSDDDAMMLQKVIRGFGALLTKRTIHCLKREAAEAERAKVAAEAAAREQVIRDISHSVKNTVAAVVAPLDELVEVFPEQRIVLEKALRGARLIREIINAVNLSSQGSLKDFAYDAEEASSGGGASLDEIVRMSLETACENMFDAKFFNVFSHNFFVNAEAYRAARKDWLAVKRANLTDMLAWLRGNMFGIAIDLGPFGGLRISDSRGSRTKLIILMQELITNAIKYVSFVEKARREVSISLSGDASTNVKLCVTNSFVPGTPTHSTRLGKEVVRNLAKLMDGMLDIQEEGGFHKVSLVFPNVFDRLVRAQLAALAIKEQSNEGAVC